MFLLLVEWLQYLLHIHIPNTFKTVHDYGKVIKNNQTERYIGDPYAPSPNPKNIK